MSFRRAGSLRLTSQKYIPVGVHEEKILPPYGLPGYQASHACVRLLPRDAEWLFHWGEGWKLGPHGWGVVEHGTPVLILGRYDFGSPPLAFR